MRGRKKGTVSFKFEEAYKTIMEQAKKSGMWDDMIFQTLMREFKSANELCKRLKKDLDDCEISFNEEGSRGQIVKKSNPVIKDYVAAQKNLVSISKALEEKLANVKPNEDDWM